MTPAAIRADSVRMTMKENVNTMFEPVRLFSWGQYRADVCGLNLPIKGHLSDFSLKSLKTQGEKNPFFLDLKS